jgi:hypothetical protein
VIALKEPFSITEYTQKNFALKNFLLFRAIDFQKNNFFGSQQLSTVISHSFDPQ